MTKLVKKKFVVLAAIGCLFVFTILAFFQGGFKPANTYTPFTRTLVIDPGHGGVDGGATAIDGTRESDLNLIISLKLDAIARFCGVNTLMTRDSDSSSADMMQYSEHRDLAWRTELANNTPDAVLISIHQNCYPTSQPKGAQVLYAGDDNSKYLGNLVQNNLVSCLEPENRRLAEPAPKKLYITTNSHCPTILVECGFVSNFSDIEKLKDNNYQSSLALVLMASYMQYIRSSLA